MARRRVWKYDPVLAHMEDLKKGDLFRFERSPDDNASDELLLAVSDPEPFTSELSPHTRNRIMTVTYVEASDLVGELLGGVLDGDKIRASLKALADECAKAGIATEGKPVRVLLEELRNAAH